MLLVIDIFRVIVNVGWVLLVLIAFFILYRFLLAYLKRGTIDTKDFVELAATPEDKVQGEIQFFIKVHRSKTVKFRIYAKATDIEKKLVDKELSAGGHVINFDTTEVENGFYFYEVRTDNQKTTKLLEVCNINH